MTRSVPVLGNINTPPSLTETSFSAIKKAIIINKLESGAIYSEQAIARELGISTTPIHHALIDLAAKGFVTILPRRGFRINVLSTKTIKDLFQFRRPLETAVLIAVGPEFNSKAKREMASLLDRITESTDPVVFQKHDRAFHRFLAELSSNDFMIAALSNIWDLSDWIGARILAYDGGFIKAAEEHLDIGRNLAAGDYEQAARTMDHHLCNTEKRFLALMEQSAAREGKA